jgi:hypothetical protein
VQNKYAVVAENCGAPAKILFVEADSDVFEHSNRHNAIVNPIDVTVIRKVIPDSVLKSGLLGLRSRKS